MSGRLNWDRVREENRSRQRPVRPPRMASKKQMRLWRDLAAELRLPPPPSEALMTEATRNIDRLLRLKGRPVP